MLTLWRILTRKKTIDPARAEESSLARVLNTFDLTALGVGSTLGVGLYVLVGKVAKETAGPAVILSFLIAAIASAFAGLCYAEFGARAPKAGSAYIYSYVCVGEFIAFIIGWNLILEYIIGSASVARGMSLYIDALVNNTIKETFIDIAPIGVSFLSPYFDFLSFSIAITLSVGLAFGLKESSKANNVFTVLNIFVVLFVIIAGSTKADVKNWEVKVPSNVTDAGSGGFFPFGIDGMIKGAATCFYGFVGFDCIATTGEEVKNPQKAIPFAIIMSLLIVFVAYFSTATVVTLMVPYYLQDVNSPIPHAFDEFGWEWAKWVVTIGGIFALLASLFGAMFPLPRIIYAMANDGLVFRFLGKVNARFSTPVTGTLLAGLLTGIMAAVFEQGQLVDMMSIGTLLAYTIVAACVLLLRYSVDDESYVLVHTDSDSSVNTYQEEVDDDDKNASMDDINEISPNQISGSSLLKQFFNVKKLSRPSKLSERLVTLLVCFYCLLCLLLGLCAIYLIKDISHGVAYAIAIPSIIGFLMIVTLMSISTQPNSRKSLHFKVPFVPLIPALSILVNIYLMMSLDVTTWIRFGVWMAIGLPIYLFSAPCSNKDARHKAVVRKHQKRVSNGNTYMNAGYVDDEKLDSTNSDSAFYEGNECAEDKNVSFNKSDNDFFLRKQSVDTISNCSNSGLQENVVAIIHREDSPIMEEDEEQTAAVKNLDIIISSEEERLGLSGCSDDLSQGSNVTRIERKPIDNRIVKDHDPGINEIIKDLDPGINMIIKDERNINEIIIDRREKDSEVKDEQKVHKINDQGTEKFENNEVKNYIGTEGEGTKNENSIDIDGLSVINDLNDIVKAEEEKLEKLYDQSGLEIEPTENPEDITIEHVVNDINDIVKSEEDKLTAMHNNRDSALYTTSEADENSPEAVNQVVTEQGQTSIINVDDLPQAFNQAVQELEKIIEIEERKLANTTTPPPPPPMGDYEMFQLPKGNSAAIADYATFQPSKEKSAVPPAPPPMGDYETFKSSKVPPPPPMVDFVNFQASLPRYIVRKKSKADEPILISRVGEEVTGDEIKMGSEEHQKFSLKLSSILDPKRPQKLNKFRLPDDSSEDKPEVSKFKLLKPDKSSVEPEILGNSNSPEDNAEVEVLGVEAIRNKLNTLFKSKPVGVTEPVMSKIDSKTFPRNKEQDAHRALMLNSLNSIKLRKISTNLD